MQHANFQCLTNCSKRVISSLGRCFPHQQGLEHSFRRHVLEKLRSSTLNKNLFPHKNVNHWELLESFVAVCGRHRFDHRNHTSYVKINWYRKVLVKEDCNDGVYRMNHCNQRVLTFTTRLCFCRYFLLFNNKRPSAIR